ncbi:hypothetical protein ABPG72_008730 [Tetrahymena utriculariae]
MEKLKEFIDERLDSLACFNIKIEQYKKIVLQTDINNVNRSPTLSSLNTDAQNAELSNILIKEIVNLRKQEKRRIENENSLMQQINQENLNFCSDIHLFFSQSTDIMLRIDNSFHYNDKFNGSFEDVAKAYKLFFKKQQELKKYNETDIIHQQNLYEKIPAYLILFKWLIDLSRQKFERLIFQRSQELVQEVKTNQKNRLSIIAEAQKNCIESQQLNGIRINYQSVRQSTQDKLSTQPNLQFQNVRYQESSQQSRKNKFRLSTDGRIQTEGFFPASNKLNSCNLSSEEFINYLHVINKMTVKAPQNQQPQQILNKNNMGKDIYFQSNEHQNTYIKSSNPKQAIIVPQMAQFMISNNVQHTQNKNKLLNINVNIINSSQQNENNSQNSMEQQQQINQKQAAQDTAVLQNQNSSKINPQSSSSSSSQQSNSTTKQDFNINTTTNQDIEENKLASEDVVKAHFTTEMQQLLSGKKNMCSQQNIKQFIKHRKGSSLQITNSLNLSQNGNQTSFDNQSINLPKRYDANYQKLIFDNQGSCQNKKYGKIIPATHYPDYRNILELDNSQNILNYFMRKNYDSSANEVSENGKNLMISSLLTKNQTIKSTIDKYLTIYSAKFPELTCKTNVVNSNYINSTLNSESKERKNLQSQSQKKRRNSGLVMLSQTAPIQQLILSKISQQNQQNSLVEVSQGNQCVAVFQNQSNINKLNQTQDKFWDQNQQSCSNKTNLNHLNRTFDIYQDQQIQINQLISIEDKVNNYNEGQILNSKKKYSIQPCLRDERIHTQGQEQDTCVKPRSCHINLEKLIRITNHNNQYNIPKRPQTSLSNFEENITKQQSFKKGTNPNQSQDFQNQQQIKNLQIDNININQKVASICQQSNSGNQNINSPQPRQILNSLKLSTDLSGKKMKQRQFQHQQRKQQQIYFEQLSSTKTQGIIKNTPSNQANSLSVNSRSILYNYKQQYLPQQFSNQKCAQAQSNQNTKQKINTEASDFQSLERDPTVYFPNKNHRRRANSQLNNENLFSTSKQDTINISITNMNLITEFSNQVTSKSGAKPTSSQNNKNVSYSKQLMQIQNLQQNSINIIPPFTNLEILNKFETAQNQQKDGINPQQNSYNNNNSNINNFNKIIQKMVYR